MTKNKERNHKGGKTLLKQKNVKKQNIFEILMKLTSLIHFKRSAILRLNTLINCIPIRKIVYHLYIHIDISTKANQL